MTLEHEQSRILHGVGIGNRRVAGRLRVLQRPAQQPPTGRSTQDKETEWARLQAALKHTAESLSVLYRRTLESLGESEAQIFEIHGMLLEDEDFLDALREEINKGRCAEAAVEQAVKRLSAVLEGLDDAYLSARATDLRDIATQIVQSLSSGSPVLEKASDEPYILAANDLSPSETVMLEKSLILGFVTSQGSPNSHTAILARAMGIPALVSVGGLDVLQNGRFALLDAAEGTLILDPSDDQRRAFAEQQSLDGHLAEEHERYLRGLINKPAVTQSGHRMLIYANIGDSSEVEAALSNGADGIGLLRSEFLYLGAHDYPSEEHLFEAYRDVAVSTEGRRAVIRTLDIGADKQILYFGLPHEENPALGYRAIRICLAREDLFKTQLRAILRASAYGRLSIMLPMIVSVDEVRQSKRLLAECMDELRCEGKTFDPKPELGIMIETPAAVIMCEELAKEVDFFSVGTNDLAQYTLAADRQNPALAHLFEQNNEPILRMIGQTAKAIHQNGGWIGICGEMAADLQLTQRFADLLVDELSVSPPYLLGLRGKVCECK